MNTEKSRRAQLVSRMRELVWGVEGGEIGMELMNMRRTSFEDYDSKYDSTMNTENYTKHFWMWGIMQKLGYMLHETLLDIDTIYTLLRGHNTLLMWDKYKQIIYEQRKKYMDPSWFTFFEDLGEEIRKHRVKQGISAQITDADGYLG